VLAWALGHSGSTAILDDLPARRCAEAHAILCIGTLGLVLRAKRLGRIPAARPAVTALRLAGLYLSDGVTTRALALVGE
jgi:predicted nucleic acid-binding protein